MRRGLSERAAEAARLITLQWRTDSYRSCSFMTVAPLYFSVNSSLQTESQQHNRAGCVGVRTRARARVCACARARVHVCVCVRVCVYACAVVRMGARACVSMRTADNECAVRVNQLRLLQRFRVAEMEHAERRFTYTNLRANGAPRASVAQERARAPLMSKMPSI
jgi:hypothetical protein